jgi:DNA-binding transcriptional ArsR family regulator
MNTASHDADTTVAYRFGTKALGALGLSQQQDGQASPDGPAPDIDTDATDPSSPSGDDGEETDTDADASEEASELPLDQVFEILKNSRRRETLHYLEENGGEASLSDLAEHIAAIENDTTVAAISSSQRKRVYVGLYQCHLPKMDDMDIVDFNQNRGTIRRAANADQLDPYLEDSTEPPWHRIYGAVSLAAAGLFGLSVATGAPFGFTPAVVLAALIVAIGACAFAHASSRTDEE